MFLTYEVQLLSVRDYNAKTRAQQRELLPNRPGIYIWTVDLGFLAEPPTIAGAGAPPALFERLQDRMKPVDHEVTGRIGHYHRVALRVHPTNLTSTTQRRVAELEASGSDLIEWALLCGTLFQRPLYVGKALSLRTRIRGHLKGGSRLRSYLKEVGLQASDCVIILAAIRSPNEPTGGGRSEDTQPETPEGEEEDLPDDDEEELSPGAPAELLNLNTLVSVAESLTIRLSHPLLNRKQD